MCDCKNVKHAPSQTFGAQEREMVLREGLTQQVSPHWAQNNRFMKRTKSSTANQPSLVFDKKCNIFHLRPHYIFFYF